MREIINTHRVLDGKPKENLHLGDKLSCVVRFEVSTAVTMMIIIFWEMIIIKLRCEFEIRMFVEVTGY
jgi:hypothetical protein